MEHSEALSLTGPYSQQCKALLRHSMAAIIVSVSGYTMASLIGLFSIATLAIPSGSSPVFGTFLVYILLMFAFTLPVTLAGSILIKLPDRQFTLENLQKVRIRSIAGVVTSAIAAIGSLVTGLVIPLVVIQRALNMLNDAQSTTSTGNPAAGNIPSLDPHVKQAATTMLYAGVVCYGGGHLVYFIACLVVCSLLLSHTNKCMRIAAAGPKHSGRQYMAV